MVQLVDKLKNESCPAPAAPREQCKPAKEVAPTELHLGPGIKAAIVAQACAETGRAEAKLLLSSDREPKPPHQPACTPEPPPCGRRNGLDPTHSELRGQRKFEYLPRSSKIPDYKGAKCRTGGLVLSDHLSTSSAGSGLSCRKRVGLPVPPPKPACPKNIPAARLAKYTACISKNNGLQDRCDSVAKYALKTCCKAKK